ncbi:hypothetical protein QTI51_17285 [Variovorax sp. J22G73]|uniref:hypothetical protein n=1 Tax=unclassified Variovorax TaxID=663243 RepID=UPI002578E1BF|nr:MULTISPECIES: hypothetical protein [unclassified Variovorax]MDM0007205.1 hypothetical protein [Variovorax sp. J22R203]MDM0099043.1 hypothetical protein [Variovorax sp. J22G73]
MSLMQVLLVSLGLSVAGNAALGWAWVGVREKAAITILQRDDARAVASACSDATDELRELADKRGAEAKKAQAIARDAATARQKTAQTVLSTPAAVPGDACASAQVRVDAWLRGRAQP